MRFAHSAFLLGLVWIWPAAADTGAVDTAIAIYENGFSLVEERRNADVTPGRNVVSIDDLPDGFQADSAVVELGDSKAAVLRAQRFRRASTDLLSRFEGEKVHIVTLNPATGEEVVREGVLLRASPLLVDIDGRVEISPPGRIALPGVPEGAVLKSRLVLDFDAAAAGALDYRLTYLATGPGWSADYALRLDPSERWAVLDGRANLRIPDGRTYRNAAVRLVAGSVNRVSGGPSPRLQAKGAVRMMASESLATADRPVAVAEVQVYAVPGRIDLLAGAEEKAILFPSVRVAVEKSYHLASPVNAHVRGPVGAPQRRHPIARLSFANDTSNGLGLPLPRGAIRVYGQGLLLGEDRLAHTPKGEKVRVTTGQAYDIVVRRKRTDYRVQGLPKGTSEVAYELSLRNTKSEGVTVEATELMAGDWRILSESLPHRRESDRRAVWRIAVPAGGKTVLRYRVRTKFR